MRLCDLGEIRRTVLEELEGKHCAAAVGEKWVELRAEVARGRIHGLAMPRCAWELAQVNGGLSGGAKIGVRGGCARIFREIWIGSEESREGLEGLVREGLEDVEEARRRLRGGGEMREAVSEEGDLGEIIRAAGWGCNVRAEGKVSVQLETPGVFVQAMVSWGRRISAVVESELEDSAGEGTGGTSREAIGMVLLQISGSVRWVRGGVREGRAVLEGRAGEEEVGHLLSALSVAAGVSVREVRALANEETAKRFLAMRGWSSRSREGFSTEEYGHESSGDNFVFGS